ncbi:MAG: hypothetical protein II724_05550, partial [Clostridia bacterium]|nr:hypothetical protein [Clostridia bacterium]
PAFVKRRENEARCASSRRIFCKRIPITRDQMRIERNQLLSKGARTKREAQVRDASFAKGFPSPLIYFKAEAKKAAHLTLPLFILGDYVPAGMPTFPNQLFNRLKNAQSS